MPEATQDPVIPADAGLKPGASPGEDDRRRGRELVDAAAVGGSLSPAENDDLVAYYLDHEELPGDSEPKDLTVTLGTGRKAKVFSCSVHAIEWDEWQDARERATTSERFDAYVSSSWIVARALVTPKLGPTVARLQAEKPDSAPENAAELLQRMFRKQSGALLELSGKVLELSKLQSDSDSVKEVEAAKN